MLSLPVIMVLLCYAVGAVKALQDMPLRSESKRNKGYIYLPFEIEVLLRNHINDETYNFIRITLYIALYLRRKSGRHLGAKTPKFAMD